MDDQLLRLARGSRGSRPPRAPPMPYVARAPVAFPESLHSQPSATSESEQQPNTLQRVVVFMALGFVAAAFVANYFFAGNIGESSREKRDKTVAAGCVGAVVGGIAYMFLASRAGNNDVGDNVCGGPDNEE